MNEFEHQPGFLDRFKEFYVANKHLSPQQFDEAKRRADQVAALDLLPGVWWGVTPQITSMYPHLLTSVKLQAQAAGFNVPFKGVGDYLAATRAAWLTKRSVWDPRALPPAGQRIGKLFIDLGLINKTQLQQILGLQQLIADETGTQARFGMLVMRVGSVSLIDLLQVVGLQSGVPFDNVDQFITDYEKRFNTSASP